MLFGCLFGAVRKLEVPLALTYECTQSTGENEPPSATLAFGMIARLR
jgi:hypothetical protein